MGSADTNLQEMRTETVSLSSFLGFSFAHSRSMQEFKGDRVPYGLPPALLPVIPTRKPSKQMWFLFLLRSQLLQKAPLVS